MKRFFLWFGLLGAVWPLSARAADSIGNMGDVKLKGYLGERLDAMIARHVGGCDVDYLTSCFQEKTERRGWWQTEFWGKYMHAAVPLAVYSGSPKIAADLDRGVARVLAAQEPCGYIGNYPDDVRLGEGWDVWGIKYTMMGLIHYYDGMRLRSKVEVDRGSRALAACKKLCDYVIAEIGPGGKRGREVWQTGNWSGYASSSILEPVVWLYRRTKDRRYLGFADFLVKGLREPETGPRLVDLALKGVSVADRNGYGNRTDGRNGYVMKHNRWKAYEMMSCYQGMLDYVEEKTKAEGEADAWKDLRRAAVMTGEDIAKEEVNLAGGCACSEAWFHGAKKQHLPYERLQETCVTTTWMRFCEKLLATTGDVRWADQIERSFYNAYLGALKPDGSVFAAYTPLSGSRWRGMDHCYMHQDCCTANGPRGFLCFLKELFRVTDAEATVNFYSSALVQGVQPASGRKVAFDMYSLYPRDGYVRLVSHTEGPLPLRLRIPAWSEKTSVRLNGEERPDVKAGAYYTLSHDWKLGDVVEITFDLRVRAHLLGGHVAFTRGPVLLARDSRLGGGDLSEALRAEAFADGGICETFLPVRTPSGDFWMTYSATLPFGTHAENPEASRPTTVFFCDYASAGNAWARDNFYRTWFPIERRPWE